MAFRTVPFRPVAAVAPCAARLALLLFLVPVIVPAVASAFPTEPPKKSGETVSSDAAVPSKERARAEKAYRAGYDDAMAAKKLSKEGKTAKATQHFAKALEQFEEAIGLDERYAEAWNMIGYCSRRVGDLTRSFQAYRRALEIDPDLEAAHEYLGMAYVQAGNLEKAREQLAWLHEHESAEAPRSRELAEAIEAAAGGGSAAGADSTGTGPTAADSTGAARDTGGW